MLEITGLTKRFGKLPVLQDVGLVIRPGRVTAVLGPNGAGKTTLIKSVLGLTRPDAGTILLDGQPIAGAGAVGDAYRARIGYMAQIARFPAPWHWSVRGASIRRSRRRRRSTDPCRPHLRRPRPCPNRRWSPPWRRQCRAR